VKISSTNQTAQPGPAASARSNGPTPPGVPDQAELSSASRLIPTESAQHRAKIAQLSAAIQAGRYAVPASEVSRALVAEALSRSGGLPKP
jgi:anti-sigma28 factor (negative regulator of flagellin synthesis)